MTLALWYLLEAVTAAVLVAAIVLVVTHPVDQ